MNSHFAVLKIFIVIICIFGSTSCKEETVHGEGKVITEERSVTSFDKVVIDLPADVDIHINDEQGLTVKTYGNLQEYILTEVSDGTLRVYKKSGIMKFDFSNVDINIQLPAISKLEINGAAEAKIDGDIAGASFELKVRGASDVQIADIHVEKLNVLLSGASELNIVSGTVDYANYKVTGAGEIDASTLKTNEAKARVSGAGDMKLFVTEKLDAHISGAGEISYTGHPELKSKVTGLGSITDRN